MAQKKKTKLSLDRSSFYNQYQESSQEDIKETEKIQKEKQYNEFVSSLGKKMMPLDIGLLDDAPPDWNRFPRLRIKHPTKYAELYMSIDINGILSPLIVWRRPNDRYMILAGHNRRDASQDIINDHEGEPDFDFEKYKKVPCMVFDIFEIDEEKAQEIIIDTNYIQRENNTKETAWIIRSRMNRLVKQKNSKGQSIQQLSESMGIKKSAIYETLSILNNVIEPFQEMYFDEKITKKGILKLTHFDELMQQWMLDEFGEKITDQGLKKLKKSMTMKESIREVFNEEPEKLKTLTIKIPENRYEEFQELFNEFLAKI